MRAAVDELLQLPVALIVAHSSAAPLVQREAAGRVPLIFAFSGDPVEAGLVTSFARPGGNTTGVSFMALELVGKRLELIKDMLPTARRVAILANPQHPGEKAERKASLLAAERLGLEALVTEFSMTQDFQGRSTVFAASAAMAWSYSPTAACWRALRRSPSFRSQERLLCVSGWVEFAHAGCIASYGPDISEGYHRMGHFADSILRGMHPSNLPVELPRRVQMVVNAQTAKALGVTLAPGILLRADEVIR